MELLIFLAKGYLTIGVLLGIISLFISNSKGFREYLNREGEEWTWKDDIQAVLEAVFLWPLFLTIIFRGSKDD